MSNEDRTDLSAPDVETGTEDEQDNPDSATTTYEDARFQMRTTKHADAIVRELAHEDYQRPSELFPKVKDRTDISRSNFYNLLGQLEGTLLKKQDGPGRATLYTLTDAGDTVADEFDLTPSTDPTEQTGPVIRLAEESVSDAIWEIMQHKNLTCDDLDEWILPKLRTREQEGTDESQTADQ